MSSNRLRFGRRSMIGHAYVLTTRCTQNARWFETPDAVEFVVMQLRRSDQIGCTKTLAWVVMPDHIHWMFELRESTLAHVARRLKSSTALALNRSLGRQGKVWQPGYHDHCLRADAAVIRHARYIMGNPVRAGLAERIGEYPYAWCRWSLDP
ncbi:transposase [Stenotrophomonas sp. 278]|uniref:REP-associated tyrosine transposase n=1 Tax=Stenotrophomonas sp. 278 TaxID=2479851 RepID=UPI000F67B2D6|nr:transposase [Stenotrophomonas sp. 278]RRU06691.1 transposase [Stenotrophomonas sp. 278]